jgi:hypothetical protein
MREEQRAKHFHGLGEHESGVYGELNLRHWANST